MAAATWQTQNPSAYQKEIEGYMDKSQSVMQPQGLSSRGDVQQHNADMSQNIQSMPTSNPKLEEMRQKHNLHQEGNELEAKLQARQKETRQTIEQHQIPLNNEEMQHEMKNQEEKFEQEKGRYLAKKAWDKVWK